MGLFNLTQVTLRVHLQSLGVSEAVIEEYATAVMRVNYGQVRKIERESKCVCMRDVCAYVCMWCVCVCMCVRSTQLALSNHELTLAEREYQRVCWQRVAGRGGWR